MPQVQEVLADDHEGSGVTRAATAHWLFAPSGALIWRRRDWPLPVGSLDELDVVARRSQVRGSWFDWSLVRVPELRLERGAALLLLQGQRLSDLLIPNHELVEPSGRAEQLAHVLLRVDPWEVWRAAPRLTGLVLARLGSLPLGVPPTELLATLAMDSAPA